ncbi:hypothetical protein Tco_0083675 [Tanacetum coccineum]
MIVSHFVVGVAAPLSNIVFHKTHLKSSSGDSSERPLHSSLHSAGPSRKRCRSSVDSVPSSMPVMGSLGGRRILDDPIKTEVDMGLVLVLGRCRVHVAIGHSPRDVSDGGPFESRRSDFIRVRRDRDDIGGRLEGSSCYVERNLGYRP